MLSRFYRIPERHGQTDRRTDRIAILISRVSMLTRHKNLTEAQLHRWTVGPICTHCSACQKLRNSSFIQKLSPLCKPLTLGNPATDLFAHCSSSFVTKHGNNKWCSCVYDIFQAIKPIPDDSCSHRRFLCKACVANDKFCSVINGRSIEQKGAINWRNQKSQTCHVGLQFLYIPL